MTDPGQTFAVLGDPVAHSRSAVMHNAAFAELGLPHRYEARRVVPAALGQALAEARERGMGGLNLTVPHKLAAMGHMDEVVAQAWRIRAVNCVVVDDHRLVGHNTDAPGFIAALDELGGGDPRAAIVLGSGGASKAVVDALLHAYPSVQVRWVSRTPGRLPVHPRLLGLDYEAVAASPLSADLLVNGTTVGMHGGPDAFPVALDLETLTTGARVIDVTYPRKPDGLLDAAEAAGHRVQDGRSLLLWQGIKSLELWLAMQIPDRVREAMRNAVQTAM